MKFIFVSLFIFYQVSALSIELVVNGNYKTHQDVLEVELKDILLKKIFTSQDLIEAKRRIWNLRIFSEVEAKVKNEKLIFKVDERWTMIPIAKAIGGGGTSYYAVGAFDINSFGMNTELGAQYESLNNRPAGVVWLRKPQFLKDRNLRFGMDLWNINRVRFFFKRNSDDNGAFTLIRKRYNTFIEKRWDNDLYTLGFQYDFHIDEISDFGISDENKDQNLLNNFNPETSSTSRWHNIYFRVGRLNFQNYLVDGTRLSLSSALISISGDNSGIKSAHQFRFQYYKLFENHHNFAWQFRVRGNNTEQLQYAQYMGGLAEVRGYKDGQFYSDTAWQNNIEYRFDLFEHKWVVLQGVVFSDSAKEGRTLNQITESGDEIMLSSGFGVRFISPKIFSFVGRLDYAQTHTRVIERGIAFGIQQFF